MISFAWDDNKIINNIKKHNVSFVDASSVFFDEEALLINDQSHSENEERFLILGLDKKGNVLVVSHTYRQEDEVIRIISARKATKNEIKTYYSRRSN